MENNEINLSIKKFNKKKTKRKFKEIKFYYNIIVRKKIIYIVILEILK